MGFFLSKLLPLFVYPVGLACVLLGAGLVLGRRRPRLLRALAAAVLGMLLLGGNRWVALRLVRGLEWRHEEASSPGVAGAIVVLGGATHVTTIPLPGGASADRLAHAAELYRAELAPHILLVGGGPPWRRGASEARRMASILVEMGIPESALWLEEESRNTRENAVYSARALAAHGAGRVLLVTSALHMPRAVRAFTVAGVEVEPAPAGFLISRRRWQRLWQSPASAQAIDLLPTAGNLSLTTRALKEYCGLAVYRLRGWV